MATQSPIQGEKDTVAKDTHASSVHHETKDFKEVKVQSVELADAIAKDSPNYWSASQIQLYGIMLFTTLSMHLMCFASIK